MASLCEYARTCPVFTGTLQGMPHTALRYRERYCMASIDKCARYRLARAAGRDSVPATMLPNQDSIALDILTALD